MLPLPEKRPSLECASSTEEAWFRCVQENPRQQNKLADFLLATNAAEERYAIIQNEAPSPFPQERRILLKAFRQGGLDRSFEDIRIQRLFELIPARFPAPEEGSRFYTGHPNPALLKEIAENNLGETFIFLAKYHRSRRIEHVDDILPDFIDRYSTPLHFFELIQEILSDLAAHSSPLLEKVAQEAHQIQRILYGKQSEYWDQYQLLQRRAFRVELSPPSLTPEPIPISSEESLSILHRTTILTNEPREPLTTLELSRLGLGPVAKCLIEGQPFFFSRVFSCEQRTATIGYTPDPENPGSFHTRSFYLSGSQNTWRLLPFFSRAQNGAIHHFFKGEGETQLTLAIALQKTLAFVANTYQPTPLSTVEAERAFYGAAASNRDRFGNDIPDAHEKRAHSFGIERKGRDFIQGACNARRRDFHLRIGSRDHTDPASIRFFQEGEAPDFSHPRESWKNENETYGIVQNTVFLSKNKRLLYVFCRDVLGRAWISHVENRSDLSVFGGKSFPVEAGDLTTPAYEYHDRIFGYENNEHTSDRYVDAYKYYLQEIPIIQAYQASLKAK